MSAPPADRQQALLRRAIGAHRQGRVDEAESLYEQLLKQYPAHAEALRLGGILARQRGNLDLAVQRLEGAAAAAPRDSDGLCELGLSYLAAGDLQAAEHALRGALDRDDSSLKALANLGAVLQYRQHLAEAIGCYRRVIGATPNDLQTRANLASALLDADSADEALAECDTALDELAPHPLLLATRGAILNAMERFEAALEALQQAIAADPGNEIALTNLAYAQRRLNRADLATATLRQAVKINPDNARATADLVNLLAAGNAGDEALERARSFLAQHPGERQVLAAYALALWDRADPEAAALLDYERLVSVTDLKAAEGFDSLAEFNGRLAAFVKADPSITASPVTKATRGGGQTGQLDFGQDIALCLLQRLITTAVQQATQRLNAAGLKDHPAMAFATDRWTLRAWGTVLTGGGQQIPHLHPVGWLSGVYYVRVPEGMDDKGPQAGWLEFGKPIERWTVAAQPALRAIQPREGRLVLFPSYLLHRTRAFEGSQRRISIAFDVVPTALSGAESQHGYTRTRSGG